MFWNGWHAFTEALRGSKSSDATDLQLATDCLGELRFIWLRREDKLRQAISFWRATHPKEQFRYPTDPEDPINVPEFDYDTIAQFLALVTEQESAWGQWFAAHGVHPCEVIYEEFVTDRNAGVKDIINWLGTDSWRGNLQDQVVRQQADEHSERYVEMFVAHQALASQA